MNFWNKVKDMVKTTVKKVTATDLRKNLAEYNETVTQILIGMHSDINSLKDKIEILNNKIEKGKDITPTYKKTNLLVYLALFLSLLSLMISVVK